jgi:hypothetical protein
MQLQAGRAHLSGGLSLSTTCLAAINELTVVLNTRLVPASRIDFRETRPAKTRCKIAEATYLEAKAYTTVVIEDIGSRIV